MRKITEKNAKRLIKPIIFLALGWVAIIMLMEAFFMVNTTSHFLPNLTLTTFLSYFTTLNPISLVAQMLSTVFIFVGIFFSVEEVSFTDSIKKSLRFANQHKIFLVPAMILNGLHFTILSLIPTLAIPAFSIPRTILSLSWVYVALVMIAASLIYYQHQKSVLPKTTSAVV